MGVSSGLEPNEDKTEDEGFKDDLTKILGVAYTIARLPWSQLKAPEYMRRILQMFWDQLVTGRAAIFLTRDRLFSVKPVEEIKAKHLDVEISVKPTESTPEVTWEKRRNVAHMRFNISEKRLSILWGILELERVFRFPASQFFEREDIAILARYGIGLYIRVGESVFTLVEDGQNEVLHESLRDSVATCARQIGQPALSVARDTAISILDRERAYYDRYTVICPASYEDRDYKDDYHKPLASYGMVVNMVNKSKDEALRSIGDDWFEEARTKVLQNIES
jgi:hypothetical protein